MKNQRPAQRKEAKKDPSLFLIWHKITGARNSSEQSSPWLQWRSLPEVLDWDQESEAVSHQPTQVDHQSVDGRHCAAVSEERFLIKVQ